MSSPLQRSKVIVQYTHLRAGKKEVIESEFFAVRRADARPNQGYDMAMGVFAI